MEEQRPRAERPEQQPAHACRLTPAAVLLFRFNNPDALLVLLLTVAAYCATRSVQATSWRWLVLVGVAVGAAFLTKMMQAFLVLPGFFAAYLALAQARWRTRLLHVAASLAAAVSFSVAGKAMHQGKDVSANTGPVMLVVKK